MDRGRFREVVAEAIDALPEPFLKRLQNVEIVVEDEPPAALLREMGLDPRHDTLFGLYEGTPLSERSQSDCFLLPDRITLFYRPLIESCRTPRQLRREIRKTVIHEVAHFFGMDEDEVADEGY
jgi:predicted Zn-dependent protease with MMP-like domain